MTTILITGATGFCGSHALDHLSGGNAQLIAACRDARKLPDTFQGEVRCGDLRDPGYRARLFDGVDVLIHAASWSSLWSHADESAALYLTPTLATLEAAQLAGVKRIVNISTTSAAAPEHSRHARAPGIIRPLWPHLCNLVRIEDRLRDMAGPKLAIANLRLGLFAGARYGLGLLPILLPRLKTHLVPWVAGGRTGMPIIDGRDVGQALGLAATVPGLSGFNAFNVVGPTIPSVREVITFLHEEYQYPMPHFNVPFSIAYPFAWLMERLDPISPWDPLVTRSIIHLLEETGVTNHDAIEALGYRPRYSWRTAVRTQLAEMQIRQTAPMAMTRPVN